MSHVSYPKFVRVEDITLLENTNLYRYWLYLPFYENNQTEDTMPEPLCVILKNPSVANKDVCDRTISKVCNVAFLHHYPGVIILNMFPYRSTKPKGVLVFYHKCIDEYKDEMKKNLDFIAKCCTNRDVVYAWGNKHNL